MAETTSVRCRASHWAWEPPKRARMLFQRAGAPEALAELLGSVDRGDVPSYGQEAERLGQAREWAITRLGPIRFT